MSGLAKVELNCWRAVVENTQSIRGKRKREDLNKERLMGGKRIAPSQTLETKKVKKYLIREKPL